MEILASHTPLRPYGGMACIDPPMFPPTSVSSLFYFVWWAVGSGFPPARVVVPATSCLSDPPFARNINSSSSSSAHTPSPLRPFRPRRCISGRFPPAPSPLCLARPFAALPPRRDGRGGDALRLPTSCGPSLTLAALHADPAALALNGRILLMPCGCARLLSPRSLPRADRSCEIVGSESSPRWFLRRWCSVLLRLCVLRLFV